MVDRLAWSMSALCCLTLVCFAPAAFGQTQLFAYPKAGQSQERQARDQSECHHWAVQQSAFDPYRPAPQPQTTYTAPPPSTSRGGLLRGGARGAAVGAVGGAIAGDAGRGAAIGAATGALFGAMRRRDAYQERAEWEYHQQQQIQQQQQQIAHQQAQGQQNYDRAYAACMTARDYVIQ